MLLSAFIPVLSLISINISSEVNLGLKLVDFSLLDGEFSNWEIKLLDLWKQKDVSSIHRFKISSHNRFNINKSVKKLECIYG